MKNKSKLTLLAMLTCACTNQNSYNLTGEISGLKNDSIIVYMIDPITKKATNTDTVAVKDNKFAVNIPDSSLTSLYIIEKPKGNETIRTYDNPLFLFLPGEKMKIHGDIDNLSASGTEIYDKLNEAKDITNKEDELKGVRKMFTEAHLTQNQKAIDSLNVIIKELNAQLSTSKLNYIKNNPNSILSGYLFQNLRTADGIEAEKLLGENLKNGVLGKLISNFAFNYRMFDSMENIKPGKPAPNFKLKNLDGEYMTLDSFKGKYVLLDFWGTWCGPCKKGMPDMKKYYAKYSNKMEIVGICCRDTEKEWREGVEELQLPWTNLYNGQSDEIISSYAVLGYPTKILIDSEGKIVEISLGESEDFYKKLDELFRE
ncbi:TlpA disulfide reductase family protein [uncultured Bacteroides sp.]|uniref:TlpA disulfide reductase family protein n=1 Tax=uncultured Bacteroides sp. TaxID=162156 RepID=UPI00262EB486|nr:TlpA disulfide reductase family protein [uncultured Bacteroides sp.]